MLLLLLPLANWTAGGLPWCCLGSSCPMATAAMPHCTMNPGPMPTRCGISAPQPLTLLPALLTALPPAVSAAPAPRLRRLPRAAATATSAPGWRDRIFHPPPA
ncbi:MAG TPA: hypothetical protein VNF74_04220 [Terriglobales bacterium]|nr:hypothetical protein [Terriglobales bacterium]